jgi:hypothetical protein
VEDTVLTIGHEVVRDIEEEVKVCPTIAHIVARILYDICRRGSWARARDHPHRVREVIDVPTL